MMVYGGIAMAVLGIASAFRGCIAKGNDAPEPLTKYQFDRMQSVELYSIQEGGLFDNLALGEQKAVRMEDRVLLESRDYYGKYVPVYETSLEKPVFNHRTGLWEVTYYTKDEGIVRIQAETITEARRTFQDHQEYMQRFYEDYSIYDGIWP